MLMYPPVAVLDGRSHKFKPETDLSKLDQILPPFDEEVPEGAFAWVGYTVNKFTTNRGINLGLNVMWVVVMGTPN